MIISVLQMEKMRGFDIILILIPRLLSRIGSLGAGTRKAEKDTYGTYWSPKKPDY
jgi:hypothetical protein